MLCGGGVQRSFRKKNFLTPIAGSLALVGPLLPVGVISSRGHLPCSLTVRYPHSRGGGDRYDSWPGCWLLGCSFDGSMNSGAGAGVAPLPVVDEQLGWSWGGSSFGLVEYSGSSSGGR